MDKNSERVREVATPKIKPATRRDKNPHPSNGHGGALENASGICSNPLDHVTGSPRPDFEVLTK